MDSSNIFIEDNAITLPVLKNGVTRIGDLWDCHRSVSVGENLFNENLDGEYVDASAIETLDYKLIHSRSTSEEMKTVKVGGEISLELLGGLIAVKGGADYKNDEKISSKVEKLICYYERETYSVSAKPNAKQVMNQEIMEKILKKELRATHFVRTVTLGAEVRADIQVSSSDKKSFSDVSGDFFGKITYGPISASIKAKLGSLGNNTDLNMEINIHSKPAMKTEPKSIEEMFRMIENISTIVKDEKHYPKSGKNVVGVPIRFLLVPIKQFLDFNVEKLYIKMTEKVMHDFNEMLVKIHDYRVPDYISRLVLNQIPELSIILNDELSSLSSEIRKYEKGLRDVCVDYFEKSINTFKQYKVKETSLEELLEIINQFESKCSSTEIDKKITGFADEGEAQLRSVHWVDIHDYKQNVEVLTNQNKLENFIIGDKEIKILLHTDHESPEGVFIRFYKMAEPLRKLGCRLGVAIQAISPKFKLIVKVNGAKHHYDVKEEIPYILSIIAATVGVGFDNERLFHSLNAEILNTRLPFKTSDELSDINNLIRNSRLENAKNFTIAKSHLETLNLLTRTDGRLKFFMPIDIIQTSFQAIRNIPRLMSSISFKNIDWIAGNLDIADKGEAGFLYIIKDIRLLAVCLDDYDLVLLKEKFDENDLNCLKFLSPEQLNHSFYSERVKTSLLIIKTIESYDYKSINFSFGMKSFQEIPDENVLNALQLISTLKSKTIGHFIGTLSKFALNERKELKNSLLRAGYSITDSSFNPNILNDESKQLIIQGAIDILESSDPLAAKINIAINIIKGSDTIPEEKQVEYSSKVNTALDNLMNDKNCPKPLIDKIKNFDGTEIKIKCLKVMKLLEQYENENEDNNNFHLKSLLSILNNESYSNVNNVLLSYINRINLDENVFGQVKPKLIKELKRKHFFQLIAYLNEVSHGIKYHIIHKGLEDLYSSSGEDKVSALDRLLTQLSDKKIFNENQWQDLWKNNRFRIIIRSLIENHRIPIKLLYLGCEISVPSYVPEDIAAKINETRVEYIDMALPDIIKDFDEFHEILKEMRRKDNIPKKFRTVLADSIKNDTELNNRLNDFAIMEKWKWNGNTFEEVIEMSSIESIVDRINEWKQDFEDQNLEHKYKPVKKNRFVIDFNERESQEKIVIRKPRIANLVMPKDLVNVFGNRPNIINSEEFICLNRIIERPHLSGDNLKQTVIHVMPYIMQKIKMWGCSALTADSISLLMADLSDNNPIKPITKRPIFGGKTQTNKKIPKQNMKTEYKVPLSRIDTIVGVLNNVSPIVGQDVLNIMAKFPLAIPLIVRSIYEKDKYKVLIPWLTQSTIKWESTPGKIVENHLFTDKFKMIVALRIGDVKRGRCGKSTVLNQLFTEKNIFSCCGEPGAKNNRPVTLKGTAEMVWLLQETVSNSLWESSLLDHYKSDRNELLLLVNLHGNALEFPDHLNFLKSMASAYILFVMPENIDDLKSQFAKVEETLGLEAERDKLSYIAIDPIDSEKHDEQIIIETYKIHDDSNIAKLRQVLKDCIKQNSKKFDIGCLKNIGLLELTETIETVLSNELISLVKKYSCQNVKKYMSLQKVTRNNALRCWIWEENEELYELIKKMGIILMLEIDSRQKAMVQLERELGIISSRESAAVQREYRVAQQEYQKTIVARSEDKVTLNQWKLKINEALDKMDNISLGLEHFFREIGKLYDLSLLTNPENNPYSVLANSYAELLIEGQAVELLDGDSSSINGPWFSAICQSVYELKPKLRIFVISILGLQSSEKSALLNAMFASKFAVSVGRCTKGLFMRLLFLDKDMKEKFEFEAILLIDTEGLGAPEKQNEPDCEKKDRVMATFAMGVSHLTIINVLGEYVNNLTEILQIAVVSMARLEKVDISPDILMVQHLTERNRDKMTNATKQFSDALENAINIADKKDTSLEIRNSSCLKKLRNNISLGKMFLQFRPFTNGVSAHSPPSEEYHQDVVALFNSIIETAHSSRMTYDFKYWSELVQIYWNSIKDENFMRFKDVKELKEYLDTSDKIFAVKESIESTFKEHSEKMKPFLNDSAIKINKQEVNREKVIEELKRIFNEIPYTCPSCNFCDNFLNFQSDLYSNVKGKLNEQNVKTTIEKYILKIREDYIKHLLQKLSAVAFRQIESDENFSKIEKQLKKELTKKSEFNELDIQNITTGIWNELERDANEKVTQIPVIAQIEEEILNVYQETPILLSEVRSVQIKSLVKIPAINLNFFTKFKNVTHFSSTSELLQPAKTYELEEKLKSIANDILNNEKVDTYRKGMIEKLSKSIESILNDLAEENDIKLLNNFKLKATIFAIQTFIKHMNEMQENWNKENNPLTILKNNKEKYDKWIRDKLRYGFGYYSDGLEAGVNLLQAILQKALKTANDKREQVFKNQNWISSSAKIRLMYLSELVEDIKDGKLDRALRFFDSPQTCISEWYRKRLESCLPVKDQLDIFKDTQVKLFDQVVEKLKELSTIEEKQEYITDFVKECDGIELRFTESTTDDSDHFSNGMFEAFEREKKQMFADNNIHFVDLTRDSGILRKLGCTMSCPYCSAICWMPYGHDSDTGTSEKHHTCHQPMGLSGVNYYGTKELSTDLCHDQSRSDWLWWKNEKLVSFWQKFKDNGYENEWKFEAHTENHFNQLMMWFFLKLHHEIANKNGLSPAEHDKLCHYNMFQLGEQIDTIMLSVYDSIYRKN